MSERIPCIYFADDDIHDREIMIGVLKKNGLSGTIVEFDNGESLLTRLEDPGFNLPDLILLDLNMPVKDGYWALNKLKSNKRLMNIPVVILTASSKEADKISCLQNGARTYFSKPMSVQGYTGIALSIMVLSGLH